MNLALLTDKVKLALLKRSGKAQGGSDRTYEGWKSKGYVKKPLISFVIQSHEKSLQVCHILTALRRVVDSEIIVIDDGSSLEHTEHLVRELIGTNEFLVRANDLYENVILPDSRDTSLGSLKLTPADDGSYMWGRAVIGINFSENRPGQDYFWWGTTLNNTPDSHRLNAWLTEHGIPVGPDGRIHHPAESRSGGGAP